MMLLCAMSVAVASCVSKSKTVAETAEPTAPSSAEQRKYGGPDKSYDTDLLRLRDAEAAKFRTFEFRDEATGKNMVYNLFIPKDYDASRKYPLVQFIADASTVGKGAEAPLKQGWGGIVWAMDEHQAENPCFVLVPAFAGPQSAVNDRWETGDEVEISFRLLQSVVAAYGIDTDRIYTTGQSMGGMISFYLNVKHPGFFAASLFVGSQWDVNVLSPLNEAKFFYIVSEGDPKASKGMEALEALFVEKNYPFARTSFSARLPAEEQDAQIHALLERGSTHNFVMFDKGTTLPAGVDANPRAGEHMYSFDYAYKIKAVRQWLFRQVR